MRTAQPRIHRWNRRQYHRLAEQGWFLDRRVELVGGRIVEMPAQKNTYVIAVGLVAKAMEAAFGTGCWVRTQAPLRLSRWSEPEPDIAVVPGTIRDYIGRPHPCSALLLVEVSDATLRYVQTVKARLYARHGIADYWILNLIDGQLEMRRNPAEDPAGATSPAGPAGRPGKRHHYTDISILTPGQIVAPLAAPKTSINIADLLP